MSNVNDVTEADDFDVTGNEAVVEPPNPARKIVRFSLDLDIEQKRFLQLFATSHGIQAAVVLRALIYCLEVDQKLMNTVLDTIFVEDDEE